MRQFVGLLKKENHHYFSFGLFILGLLVIGLWLGPLLIHNYANSYSVHGIRLTLILSGVSLLVALSIVLFYASLRTDIKQKDLWLHNTQSIYTLIGAKIVYHGLLLAGLSSVTFIGLFFIGDLIRATAVQYLFFYVYCLFLVILTYIAIIVVSLCFYSFNIQVKRFIGKISHIVTFAVVIIFFNFIDKLPDTYLPYGAFSPKWMSAAMPTFTNSNVIEIKLFEIYLVEELVGTLLFIFLYVIACKWIERVIAK